MERQHTQEDDLGVLAGRVELARLTRDRLRAVADEATRAADEAGRALDRATADLTAAALRRRAAPAPAPRPEAPAPRPDASAAPPAPAAAPAPPPPPARPPAPAGEPRDQVLEALRAGPASGIELLTRGVGADLGYSALLDLLRSMAQAGDVVPSGAPGSRTYALPPVAPATAAEDAPDEDAPPARPAAEDEAPPRTEAGGKRAWISAESRERAVRETLGPTPDRVVDLDELTAIAGGTRGAVQVFASKAVDSGLLERVGGAKSGRYRLRREARREQAPAPAAAEGD